jgi:hypothetical protein
LDIVALPISSVLPFFKNLLIIIVISAILSFLFNWGDDISWSLDFIKRIVCGFKVYFYLGFAVLTFFLQIDTEAHTIAFGMPARLTLTQILIIPISVFEALSNFIETLEYKK